MAHQVRRLRAFLPLVGLVLALGARSAEAQCNTTQLCAPGAGTCTISSGCTVPAGATFDIRPRPLVIGAGKTLTVDTGTAPLTIRASSILFEPGARIVALGTAGTFGSGGQVVLEADTTLTLQSQGTSKAKIDVNGAYNAGLISLTAGGNIDINAILTANTASLDGFGGQVDVTSLTGSVSVAGDGVQTRGGGRGENGASGGSLSVISETDITVSAPIDVSGGDCVCDISLDSRVGNINVTSTGDFELSGAGQIGDGGSVNMSAGGNVTMAGDIIADARGSGGDSGYGGGFGGDVDIFAQGTVTSTGRVEVNGASPDGDAGTASYQAGLDVNLGGSLFLDTIGFGAGGDVFLDASRNATITAPISATGDIGAGGSVDMSAAAAMSVSSTVSARATDLALGYGGTISLQACSLDLTPTGYLDSRGLGAFPGAANNLASSNQMLMRGKILAGSANILRWRNAVPSVTPPPLTPPVVSPAVTIQQDNALPCCGVSCAACGNSVVEVGETCDDGNTAGGDCCSGTCQKDAAGTLCTTDGNACTVDTCDAGGACQHAPGNAGATCRAAAGLCDVAETCTGSSATCPADVKSTAVCRPSAGACDVAESCNGVSNTCPTDVFVSAGTQCRAAAGVCDVAESCTGAAAACPTDLKSTAVCRAASGVCDAAESCDGVSNGCPADAVAPAGSECRAAAGVCDVAETCDGSGTSCPPDAKSTGECRAAAGACDVAESCDGVSDACPADVAQPNDTPCSADLCTQGATCQAGACTGGSAVVCDACESCDAADGACKASPRPLCGTPTVAGAAQLKFKKSATGPAGDQFQWKWGKGSEIALAAFGDPATTDGMTLCMFDESQPAPSLIFRAVTPPGGTCGTKPCWIASGTKGWKFVSKTGTADGVNLIATGAGLAGKSKLQVKGKGAALSSRPFGFPALPLATPVRVQLQSATGACWESSFSTPVKNTTVEFNAKSN